MSYIVHVGPMQMILKAMKCLNWNQRLERITLSAANWNHTNVVKINTTRKKFKNGLNIIWLSK